MIYTIGHTHTYLVLYAQKTAKCEKLKKLGPIGKGEHRYEGGAVFKAIEDAEEYIKNAPDYSVFGVRADWEKDTAVDKAKPFNRLQVDSEIVVLSYNPWGVEEVNAL